MDVRVYPPLPPPRAAAERARPGQLAYSEPPPGNKLDGDSMFLGVSNTGLDFSSTNQFREPQPPLPPSKLTPPSLAAPWRRDGHDTHRLPWPFSLGDEDFNIPPITPPTQPDHAPGSYHPLAAHGLPPQHHPHYHPHPTLTRAQHGGPGLSQDGGDPFTQDGPITSTLSVMQQMVNSDARFASSQQPIDAALGPRSQSGLGQQSQLTTINQSQLGLTTHNSPSPPGSKSATPSPSSSVHEDENDDTLRGAMGAAVGEKRPAAFDTPKKAKTPKKKKRKDPNEPVKPVSAYALFFRDTQANIKAQNPNATFGEVSKIVASMWDGLGEEQKQVYKKRTETAKKEYLKQLAAYRASLVSQSYNDPSEMKPPLSSSPSPSPAMFTPKPAYPGHPGQQHPSHPGHPAQQHPSHPGNQGQQHPSHPGHPGQQHPSHPGHPAQQHPSHPGNQGQQHPSHPGNQGQQHPSHPGHPGQQHPSHPGNQGQQHPSHPGHPAQQHPSHPGHPGQQHPSHPGNQGQQHPSHPGNQGQQHPSHPGHPAQQHPSHPGNQGQQHPSHPGNQGQQHPSHPGHPGQHPGNQGQQHHPSHPGNQGQQHHPSHHSNQGQHSGHQGQQHHPGHPGQQHPSTQHHPGVYPPHPHPHGPPLPSHSPSLSPHLHSQLHPQLQALSSRGAAPRPNPAHQGALSGGSVAAASPPPHQVSPPLHSQAHLGGLHSPHHHSHQQQNQQQHQHHSHLQNPHQNPHHSPHQNPHQNPHHSPHQNPHHSPHHNHMQQQLAGHPLGMTHPAAITQGYPLSLQSEYQPMGGGTLSSRVMMSSPVDYHQLGRPVPGPRGGGLDWTSEYHGSGGLQRDRPLFLS